MEILKKCEDLYEELKINASLIEFIQAKQEKPDLDPGELVHLYEEEFRLSLEIIDGYLDLNEALFLLRSTDGMLFVANRIQTDAAKIVNIKIIHI